MVFKTPGGELARRKGAAASDQAAALIDSQLRSLPFSVLIAASAGLVMGINGQNQAPLIWFAMTLTVTGVRYALARYFRPLVQNLDVARLFLMVCFVGNAMTGLLWGAIPFLFVHLDNSREIILFILMSGISAGSASQVGFAAAAAATFVPIEGSVMIRCLIAGSEVNDIVGFDCFLFILLLMKTSMAGEAAFFETLRLKTDAVSLAASLEKEHAAAKASAARLYQLANHDSLTGLANRASFAQYLGSWVEKGINRGDAFFFLLLDLDRFKAINDTLGHGAGDRVLKEVAARLSRALPQDHVVARLGGDEFAILAADPADSAKDETRGARARAVAEQILAAVNGKFRVDQTSVDISVSIGLACFPSDGVTGEALTTNADLALYAAKDGGRHGWRPFDDAMLVVTKMTRDIEHDLPDALRQGDLQVWYQPQLDLHDARLVGLEALIRWKHPSHGWIDPPAIVAAALRTHACHLLTGFVLEQACRKLRALADAGLTTICVAVNVSPRELDHYALPDVLRRLINAHGIDPGRLELEITEEAFAATDIALTALNGIADMGVRLAIDDFGAGCSSIAYLRSMRIAKIKIDGGLITGFVPRKADHRLIKTIIGIGQSMDIDVLAEGVETSEEALVLKSFGCRLAQGYVFGVPMNGGDLDVWMKARPDNGLPTSQNRRSSSTMPVFAIMPGAGGAKAVS